VSRPTNVNAFLESLKDFQRDTVDHVFQRMYLDPEPSLRFLVADEVGLGKTLVAAGVVGRAVQWLEEGGRTDRVDVVYICSNSTIARQNINRLNKTGQKNHRLPDRITLLPRDLQQLRGHKVNFISFTPGTSFDLRSKGGRSEERALLYWLLPEDWRQNEKGALSLLTGSKLRDRFKSQVDDLRRTGALDHKLKEQFHEALASPSADATSGELRQRFLTLADQLGGRSERLTDEEAKAQQRIVSELRGTLAAVCIHSLEPDLVILDEFQRFTDLLHGDDAASQLARRLFEYQDVRVLLLSATPYRMYSTADAEDKDRNAHYEDLVKTVGFLQGDTDKTKAFEQALGRYREAIFGLGKDGGHAELVAARDAVTAILRWVMVRTERLSVAKKDGMVRAMPSASAPLEGADIRSYLAMQQVARAVGHGDVTEFWKSAPYLLNFMDDYDFKRGFEAVLADSLRSEVIAKALGGRREALLSREDWLAYRRIDPGNARLRTFGEDVLGTGVWKLLWLPPAMPYYRPTGAYAEVPAAAVTKRLVFSSWQVVPKAVASWLTYEVERRMFGIPEAGEAGANSAESRKKRRGLLRFSVAEGRPTGMPVLALLYPSISLARLGDPLQVLESGDFSSTLEGLLDRVESVVRRRLQALPIFRPDEPGEEDERWYWAAPLLLDLQESEDHARRWFGQANLADLWAGEVGRNDDDDDDEEDAEVGESRGWAEHIAVARRWVGKDDVERRSLGRPPADLSQVLALFAVAGPAVSAARALARVSGGFQRLGDDALRNGAGRIASGLRSLFNQPTAMELIRGRTQSEEVPYWRQVLQYAAHGNLQAVLDEFAHVLVEDLGVSGRPASQIQKDVAAGMQEALQLRTATLAADEVVVEGDSVRLSSEKMRFRTSFAIRFGGRQTDDSKAVRREGDVQRAFNSPFWPFVLCSTSVGQEGLDFHRYCHAIVHWNLPSNPVDLEQREGRIHRFKGHAVRKNVAADHGAQVAYRTDGIEADPWMQVFHEARATRVDRSSDLVPFWVYAREGGAAIERHMPMVGLSKDFERAEALKRSLAVYRMAFGQSRQDDMVHYLLRHLTPEQVDQAVAEARISLVPDPSPNRHLSGRPQCAGELAEEEDETVVGSGVPLTLLQIEELLDEFTRIRPAPRTWSVEAFGALLDHFSALRQAP